MRCFIKRSFNKALVVSIVFSAVLALFTFFTIAIAREAAEPIPSGEQASVDKASNAAGKTYTIPSINYKMTYIPPGTFHMGSPISEKGRYADEIRHKVVLTKGFFIGVTEITQEQWHVIMGDTKTQNNEDDKYRPVDQVSWNECLAFMEKLNKRERSRRYRLPFEAEWEYACRAGSDSAFTNGDITHMECGHDPNLDRVGWYCGNTKEKTQPVAKKEPNAWGVYDMHGNAWEWCQDWYELYTVGKSVDPKGPEFGSERVFRGGGWGLNARTCRSAFRDKYAPNLKCRHLGFRLVREADK